jgi:hypothetical protein
MKYRSTGNEINWYMSGYGAPVYGDEQQRYRKKQHAEGYYALAVNHLQEGKSEMAKKFADISIYFYEEIGINTIEDAAPTMPIVRGVIMPDIMHADVVKKLLKSTPFKS